MSLPISRRANTIDTLESRLLLSTSYQQNFDAAANGTNLPDASIPGLFASPAGASYVRVDNALSQSGPNSVHLHDEPETSAGFPQLAVIDLGPDPLTGFTSEAVDISFDYFVPTVVAGAQKDYFGVGLWFGARNTTNNVLIAEQVIGGEGIYIKEGSAIGGGNVGPLAGGEWHHVHMKILGIVGDRIYFTTEVDDLGPFAVNAPKQNQNFWNQFFFEVRDNTGTHETWIDNIDVHQIDAPAGYGAIQGKVFNDADSNGGINGSEAGIDGWTLYLDANNNNALDAGETTATSDANGHYSFSELPAGTYFVKQQAKQGYRKTLPVSGTAGYTIALGEGDIQLNKNFGFTRNILLGGTVYDDANSNGIQDAGEAGLQNFTVRIMSNGSQVASRNTDVNGKWQVKGLAAGSGEALVVVKAGYTATNPSDAKYVGSASAGQQLGSLNFGLHATVAAVVAPNSTTVLAAEGLESLVTDLI